jgi:hypothetical protein
MKKIKTRFFCSGLMYVLIIASCSTTTTLLSTWSDKDYSGNIKKVLIIGASENQGRRRIFEGEFANQLKPHGVASLPSNEILPAEKMLDKETILSKIEDLNIDAVLVTKLVEKQTERVYYPSWYDGYKQSYGRVFKDQIVNLETSLYDVKTEGMIWYASSEIILMEGESIYNEIKAFIKIMVKNLAKEKFI